MKNVTEVHYFKCSCSKCGNTVENKRGVADLVEDGWLNLKDDIICPVCSEYYKKLRTKLGDTVVCLIQDESRQLRKGKTYIVCDIVKGNPASTYVDVGDGWQAKLNETEYDLV